jgi:MoxR-like ATPase
MENKNLEDTIIDKVIPLFKKRVQKDYKDIFQDITTVVIKLDDKEIKRTSMQAHEQFKNVLTLVANNIPAMLTGGAGSGKTSTCEKIAEVLGLDFYFSNAITQEYKLTGFIDANGKYQETQFYKAFKNGGLFVLDEIDASVPEALVILNTAIANGYFDFPVGKIQAHKDFRIVACANTYGLGGNDIYVGRYQLDGASLDRFALVEFNYDNILENSLVEDKEWAEFIQLLRSRIKEKRVKHILSMRATVYGDKLLKTDTPLFDIMFQVVFKNLKIDDIKTIGKLNSKNKYATFFDKEILI